MQKYVCQLWYYLVGEENAVIFVFICRINPGIANKVDPTVAWNILEG